MLFMSILTWKPSKRNEIVKRRLQIGISKEIKVIGTWTDLNGGRNFTLFEVADPKFMLAASLAWNDLVKIESIPVMEAEEVIKLAKSQAKV